MHLPCVSAPALVEQSLLAKYDLPLDRPPALKLKRKSDIMGFSVPYVIYLPKGYGGGEAYHVWYGLHGSSSSESM